MKATEQIGTTHYIRTEARVYNSVDSQEQFQNVRENWMDYSPVVDAFIWSRKAQEWQRIGTAGW